MNKCLKVFIGVGLTVVFTFLFTLTAWASLFEIHYSELSINLGINAEIEGESERYDGDIPNHNNDVDSISDDRSITAMAWDYDGLPAWRNADATWAMRYELTDMGFSIFTNMTVTTDYHYDPDFFQITDPGYAYAFSGEGTWAIAQMELTATDQTPAGTVVTFAVTTETLGTPWDVCEWELEINGVAVNQDNYDLVIFDIVAGEWSSYYLYIPYLAMQTQGIEDGTQESGFNLHFARVPVPIPASVWLLSSGLAGLIGLKRKYWN